MKRSKTVTNVGRSETFMLNVINGSIRLQITFTVRWHSRFKNERSTVNKDPYMLRS
jgi:hypothetical protein